MEGYFDLNFDAKSFKQFDWLKEISHKKSLLLFSLSQSDSKGLTLKHHNSSRKQLHAELSRQSCEIRDLLKCKSRLALDKENYFKGLKSCKILML